MFGEYDDENSEKEEIQDFINEITNIIEHCGKVTNSDRCENGIDFFKCWLST